MTTLIIIITILIIIYSILWLASVKKYSVEWGVSFSQKYAEELDLDWKEVYLAMVNELKPKYIRISAMWDEVEPVHGTYDYSRVDWMIDEAAKQNVKITLVIGQKAPRWPECFVPKWAAKLPDNEYEGALMKFIRSTVERYKTNDAIEIWQVENEPFIKFKFGECEHYDEKYVEQEVKLVESLDSQRPIMLTDSGEMGVWNRASKYSDKLGTTLYRRVKTPKGWIFSYNWLPPSFYRYKARLWGKSYEDFYVSELQAEPWFSDSPVTSTPASETAKTLDKDKLIGNMSYAQKVGASRVYLWGVEWWYFVKEIHKDGSYWELVKEKIK